MANSAALSATLNYQLSAYAQGLWNDLADVVRLAERLAPTTPVPGASGQYKTFDDKNSFMPEKTARALGGDPTLIKFSADDAHFNCTPQALEVRVDKVEDQQAGSEGNPVAMQLLDEGKIRALMNKTALSHVLDVSAFVLANTTATAQLGVWSDADIDPIDQLDQELLTISQDCGSTANIKITMDVAAWNKLRNHPKVKTRTQFTQINNISLAQLNDALIFPVDIMAANVVYDTARINQTAAKARAMAGVCLIHYSVPGATLYDPSAFKNFTVGSGSPVSGVRTYQSPNSLWRGHLMDWSRDIKKTSSLSVRRMNIS